jgi:Flp pilus assembly protein TadG
LRHTPRENKFRRRGAQAVEFAFALPVFMAILLGLVEIGRGYMVVGLLTNGAQAGCRAGIIPGATTTTVNQAVDQYLSGIGVNGYTTSVTTNGTANDPSTAAAGDAITVQVSVPVANISWVPGAQYLTGTLRGQFTLPHE